MEVASTKIGAKATVTIVRDGVEQTFTVTVAERPQTVK